ncbi:MAG: hypothetical protein PHP06_07645 [Clostridia bacterium]|nr:hypothetical protein [Clostridia bacterium]
MDEVKKEKDRKGIGFLIFVAIILAVLVTFAALFIFDIAGFRHRIKSLPTSTQDADKQASDEEEQMDEIKEQRELLEQQREELQQKNSELDQRENTIAEKEKQIEEKLKELEELIGDEKKLKKLIKLYNEMDAANAAAILEQIEERGIVIEILSNIKSDQAAEILSEMDANIAADLTIEMNEWGGGEAVNEDSLDFEVE